MAPVVERRKKIQFAKGNVYEGKPFTGVRWVEPKFDGLRGAVIAHNFTLANDGAVTLTGMNIPNATIIVKEIAERSEFDNMVIDGEFMGRNWNESQSIVKSQKLHPDIEHLHYQVFDMLTIDEWNSQTCERPLHVRKAALERALRHRPLTHVHLVPHRHVFTDDEVKFQLEQHVKAGYEGIMLKDPDSTYSFRKNNDWLKCKPIHEADFFITGAVEGRGKNAGMLGALQIMNEDLAVECEVGTGFDDATRIQLWADFKNDNLIGRQVQVEYQEITEDNSLRFPSFMRMRDDK